MSRIPPFIERREPANHEIRQRIECIRQADSLLAAAALRIQSASRDRRLLPDVQDGIEALRQRMADHVQASRTSDAQEDA